MKCQGYIGSSRGMKEIYKYIHIHTYHKHKGMGMYIHIGIKAYRGI